MQKRKGKKCQIKRKTQESQERVFTGPEQVTRNATVAELGADGTLAVLVKGTNEWVCVPGNENKIGDPPMCINPMGMTLARLPQEDPSFAYAPILTPARLIMPSA